MAVSSSKMLKGRLPACNARHSRVAVVRASASVQVQTPVRVKETGACTVRGTVRKVNEDRFDIKTFDKADGKGAPTAFAGVYDGHGGSAVAQWLQDKLWPVISAAWQGAAAPEAAITEAYLSVDKELLSATSGFLGMGERGVGGSKCGATAVNAVIFRDASGGSTLLTANVGDARIILVRDGKPVLLTEEHVPDSEQERKRIERQNPNPKMPLVRYIGGTWRVGGLLALSRALGDAYLKGSLRFEGVTAGGDGYSSGFGLIATPYTTITPLTGEDSYLVLASDGLFAEEARGGGGGLDNEQVAELCVAGAGASCTALAEALATAAQRVGSTDDVTVVVLRLAEGA